MDDRASSYVDSLRPDDRLSAGRTLAPLQLCIAAAARGDVAAGIVTEIRRRIQTDAAGLGLLVDLLLQLRLLSCECLSGGSMLRDSLLIAPLLLLELILRLALLTASMFHLISCGEEVLRDVHLLLLHRREQICCGLGLAETTLEVEDLRRICFCSGLQCHILILECTLVFLQDRNLDIPLLPRNLSAATPRCPSAPLKKTVSKRKQLLQQQWMTQRPRLAILAEVQPLHSHASSLECAPPSPVLA
jgi:hypothetical protein